MFGDEEGRGLGMNLWDRNYLDRIYLTAAGVGDKYERVPEIPSLEAICADGIALGFMCKLGNSQ